jgi:hypothetical protein
MPYVNTKDAKEQKKIGRPPINGRPALRYLQMRVTDQFLATIDDWRRQQLDLPNRTEAVRRLVELGRSFRDATGTEREPVDGAAE